MAENTENVGVAPRELERQREYIAQKKAEQFGFGLTVEGAFVRGIRDLGYKGTDTALDELFDNSLQAGAERIALVCATGAYERINALAVIDDGHGMDPEMIRLAVIWGGTHRENDRSGFGRYGYGLPSASVSQGKRYTVFSRVMGGQWANVEVDLDKIEAGDYTVDNRIIVPEAKAGTPPKWVQEEIRDQFGHDLEHGTVVLIEKLDRIYPTTARPIEGRLLPHLGLTYRNALRDTTMTVNGIVVEPVDPLFTTPGFRFYDLDEDRAIGLPPLTIDVKDSRGPGGTIKVRYSYLPPTFARLDGEKLRERGQFNGRFAVMKATNGLIVLRNGRQIDVVTRTPWTTFQNYDRYIKVEVDFPAGLDEEFSITTSKQQIHLSERMWDILKKEGVYAAINSMRSKWDEENKKLKVEREQAQEEKRASEQAMEDADKFKTGVPKEPVERKRKAEERFQQEVERKARETGKPREQVESELRVEAKENPYKVTERSLPQAPFFSVEQVGGQRVLYLNTAHKFYTDLYAGPESTPRLRAALEVLLFVLGESELDSTGDRQLFYQAERMYWSTRLHVVLDRLDHIDSIGDALQAAAERAEEDGEDELADANAAAAEAAEADASAAEGAEADDAAEAEPEPTTA